MATLNSRRRTGSSQRSIWTRGLNRIRRMGLSLFAANPSPGGREKSQVVSWTGLARVTALSTAGMHVAAFVRRGEDGSLRVSVALFDDDGNCVHTRDVLDGNAVDGESVPALFEIRAGEILLALPVSSGSPWVHTQRISVRKNGVRIMRARTLEFSGPLSSVGIMSYPDDQLAVCGYVAGLGIVIRRIRPRSLTPASVEKILCLLPGIPDHDESSRSMAAAFVVRPARDGYVFAVTAESVEGGGRRVQAGRQSDGKFFDLSGNPANGGPGDASFSLDELTTVSAEPFSETSKVCDVRQNNDLSFDFSLVHSGPELLGSDIERAHNDAERRCEVVRVLPTGQISRREVSGVRGQKWPAGLVEWGASLNPHSADQFVFTSDSFGQPASPAVVTSAGPSLYSYESHRGSPQKRLVMENAGDNFFPTGVFSQSSSPGSSHALFVLSGAVMDHGRLEVTLRCTVFNPGKSCSFGVGDQNDTHVDLFYAVEPEGAMPAPETHKLMELLTTSRSFLEFGAGGSTLLALSSRCSRVTSVETDGALGSFLERLASVANTPHYECHVVLPEILGPWGHDYTPQPSEPVGARYVGLGAAATSPSLVLVDGRFRVACALSSAKNAKNAVTILMDDYGDRPEYFVVADYLGAPDMVGRMAVFRLESSIDVPDSVINKYLDVPA